MKIYQNRKLLIAGFLSVLTITAFVVTFLGRSASGGVEDVMQDTADLSIYLALSDIPGEVIEANHQNWIEILSYSHAGSYDYQNFQPERIDDLSLRKHSPIVFVKYADKSTPKLMEYCMSYLTIDEATVEVLTFIQSQKEVFYKIQMRQVRVASFQQIGSQTMMPKESFSLIYEEIKVTYTEYDDMGSPEGSIETPWMQASWNNTVG